MKINVIKCLRCGEDHKDLEYNEIANPPTTTDNITGLKYEYWAMCPVTSKHILIAITEED